MDFSDYQPAPSVLEKLKNIDFVAVVGPTAVGKTTLMRVAAGISPMFTIVLNTTSRLQRLDEKEGIDGHFRTKQEMLERIGRREFVQVAPSVLGEVYATAPEDYPSQGVAMMAVLADAVPIFQALPFRSFRIIYILPPDWKEWETRLKTHGFEPDQLIKRLAEAKRSLEFAAKDRGIQFVVNDNIDAAVSDFVARVQGTPPSRRQAENQKRASAIIQGLLATL